MPITQKPYKIPAGDGSTVLLDLIRRVADQQINNSRQELQYATVVNDNAILLDGNNYHLYRSENEWIAVGNQVLTPGSRVLATTMDRGLVVVWGHWNAPFLTSKFGPMIAETEDLSRFPKTHQYEEFGDANIYKLTRVALNDGFRLSILTGLGGSNISVPHFIPDKPYIDGIWVRAFLHDVEVDRVKMVWGPGGLRDIQGWIDSTVSLTFGQREPGFLPTGSGPRIFVRWTVRTNGRENIHMYCDQPQSSWTLPEGSRLRFYYAI